MKNRLKNIFSMFGIAAVLAAMAFGFAACEQPTDDPGISAYTVVFNADGGLPAPTAKTVIAGGEVAEPRTMTKSGSAFDGWYTEAEFTTKWDFSADVVNGNITLYAKWVAAYTVTFQTNGGSPAPSAATVASGGKVAEPVMTKIGHILEGWYTEADFSGPKWDFATNPVSAAITLYAKWTVVPAGMYIVTFNADGGSPAPGQTIVRPGEKVAEPAATKDGYSLDGWYTEAEFATKWDFSVNTVNADMTLYAKWTAVQGDVKYTVTFNANGGSPAPAGVTVISGGKAVEPAAMTKSGYTFDGWYTEAELTTKWDFATNTVSAAATLYAKWTAVPAGMYIVTFNANGGSPAPAAAVVRPDAKIAEPAAMTKGGYTFDGWYTEADLSGGKWDFATNTVSGDSILYAKWNANDPRTVTFNANGGSPAPETATVGSGGTITEPAAMTKDGSVFDGWYKDAGLTARWDFAADTVSGDMTLYAKWAAVLTVRFSVNGGSPQPAVITVGSGGKVTEPEVTRTGYILEGWYTSSNFSYSSRWNFDTSTVSGSMTLYANWVIQRTVTFEANGGEPAPAAVTVGNGMKVPEPAALTKTGSVFDGWYINADFTGNRWNFAYNTVSGDMILYAKWVAPYTITFDANGGVPAPAAITAGEGGMVKEPVVNKDGSVLEGWYTEAEFTTRWNFASDTVDKDMTLYAKWTDLFTVTFDAVGGSPALAATTVGSGAKVSAPGVTKTGYLLDGWYTEAEYTTQWDFAVNTVDRDITLYAKWIVPYTVTFNADGGSPAPASIVVLPGGKVAEPAAMTRAGYVLEGWYTEEEFTTKWNFVSNTVDKDMTLYAKWNDKDEMVWVEGGTFEMGSESGNTNEKPVHSVTISGFYIGKYEVGTYYPERSVSWYDALVYCNELSISEGLTPAYSISESTDPADWGTVPTSSNTTWNAVICDWNANGYRLPTEAEWEYAARGGNGSPGNYIYAGSDNADEVAWYKGNSGYSMPMGRKAPNGLGLYDMSGNISEWCWDSYGTYSNEPQTDPRGANSGSSRVVRGGNYNFDLAFVSSTYRYGSTPDGNYVNYGFRLVRSKL